MGKIYVRTYMLNNKHSFAVLGQPVSDAVLAEEDPDQRLLQQLPELPGRASVQSGRHQALRGGLWRFVRQLRRPTNHRGKEILLPVTLA